MNQFVEKLVKISLITMILLSLFLSWKIWTKPTSRSADETPKKTTEVVQKKEMKDVYAPTKLFYHKDKEEILYTNRESIISSVQKKIDKMEYKNAHLLSRKAKTDFLENEEYIDMTLPYELPLSFYLTINNIKTDDLPEQVKPLSINRVILSFSHNKIYFSNRTQTDILELDALDNLSSVKEIVTQSDIDYFKVTHHPENVTNVYYMEEETELQIYSYIVATQSFTTFSRSFFNQSNDLFSNEGTDNNVNLSNSEGESLVVQSKTGEVNYYGKLKAKKENIYEESFQYIENLGNALGTLRFFNEIDSDIVYRNYVEGFPVFGDHSKGQVSITIRNSQNVQLKTNQESIQIPIPSNETKILPPTQKVLDELTVLGMDNTEVQDIQIGYEWQANVETKQVVDLIPRWYLKYKEKWISFEDLKDQLGGIN
ncbi:YycH family regulatory protein [Vagococcus sp.]|uniref:YycH family regulatory protein n=1 Tax=Vagococcus sp. TaxID=1933889 RepID=UPI003F996BCB